MTLLRQLTVLTLMIFMLAGCASLGSGPSAEDRETAQRYVEIGYRHLEFDNAQRARDSFRQALSLDGRSSGAHLGMALVYQRDGESELAEDYFHQAISLTDDMEARHLYAQFLFSEGRIDESEEELRQVTSDPDFRNRGVAFEDLAILSLYQNDMESAKTYFDRAIRLNRMLPMPYWHMTNIHLSQGNPEQAAEYFEGFHNLVDAEVMDHTEESLILGLRVTQAVEREERYSGLLEILEEQFPDSDYLSGVR